MSIEQSVSLYLQITADVRSLWFAFGTVTVIIAGWLLARKRPLSVGQRVALTIGWLSATGYVGSSLMNRYRLLAALVADIGKMDSQTSSLTAAIAEAGAFYSHHAIFVYTSLGAITLAALLLVWTDVAVQASASPNGDA